MSERVRHLISSLGLTPHPEGGWYRETYRAGEGVEKAHLPARYGGPRCFGTSILFLLAGDDYSALHRLKSDELWFFHEGGTLIVTLLHPDGRCEERRLGPRPEAGEDFQLTVPAGTWFGARLADPAAHALIGCTVSPGFEFADFELGERAELHQHFSSHGDIIRTLTRAPEPGTPQQP